MTVNTQRVNAQNMLDYCLARFGLIEKGWKRGPFTNSKKSAGVTRHMPGGGGIIQLSGPITDACSTDQTRLTILHEIAHALLDPKEGHSETWRKCCLDIGGDGAQFVDPRKMTLPQSKYLGTCENGHEIRLHRRLKVMTGRTCGKCHTPVQWKQNF